MRISDWSSDVCSSDLARRVQEYLLLGISASPAGSADRRRLRAAAALVRVEARDSQGLWLAPHGALRAGGAARRDRLVDGRIGLEDRKGVGTGKSVSVRVDLGGRLIIKKKKDTI